MKKIIILILFVVGAVALFLFLKDKNETVIPASLTEDSAATTTASNTENQGASSTSPKLLSVKDQVWTIFQKYLEYNKSHDLEGVKSVVYKVAPVCEDVKLKTDCENRMDAAYNYGSALKKENFVNVWSDEKQIILATDFWLESSKDLDQYGRFRSIIFFIKGTDGSWKLLSFSPTKGGATNKGAASQEEIDGRIVRYTEDNDNDGIADYEEECLHKPGDSSCLKTDPKIIDTDKDGWWDGVKVLMK